MLPLVGHSRRRVALGVGACRTAPQCDSNGSSQPNVVSSEEDMWVAPGIGQMPSFSSCRHKSLFLMRVSCSLSLADCCAFGGYGAAFGVGAGLGADAAFGVGAW